MIRRSIFAILATALGASAASAQFPPDKAKNLKVFPKDMPIRALLDTMRSFTGALGVRCTFCHVGQEGQPLSTFDFASDKKPEKETARTMLRMVGAINGDYLAKLVSRSTPPVVVSCVTCHRGVSQPRQLQQVVLSTYDAAGADSAIATYRALRQRYYGRAAYDFGDATLADVGGALRARSKLPDALRFYMLNLEFSPTSSFALRQAADAQAASGDTAGAIANLQKAAAANPNDPQVKRALDALQHKP